MILICGLLSDPVLRYVCAGLATEAVDFILLDARQYPELTGISLRLDDEGRARGKHASLAPFAHPQSAQRGDCELLGGCPGLSGCRVTFLHPRASGSYGGWGGWGHDDHHQHHGGWGYGYGYGGGYGGGYGYGTPMCRYADGSIAPCPTLLSLSKPGIAMCLATKRLAASCMAAPAQRTASDGERQAHVPDGLQLRQRLKTLNRKLRAFAGRR
jgi:hypothetical protein